MSDCRPQELEIERLKNRIMRLETVIKELLHYAAKGADRVAKDVRRFLERGLLC